MGRTAMSFESVMRKRRWSSEDGDRVLSALQTSGQSVTSFDAAHGVQAQRIHLWLRNRRSRGHGRRSVAPLQFVEVATSPRPPAPPSRYELALPNGAALRIEGLVEVATVRGLIRMLRRC